MAAPFTMRQSIRLLRSSARGMRPLIADTSARNARLVSKQAYGRPIAASSPRLFVTSTVRHAGLMPDTSDPPPREAEEHDQPKAATELEFEEYHRLADEYLEKLQSKLEQLQEERGEIDVEYAADVLTIEIQGKGTIVINKQPPNRQLWLSSPISGPMRFDWVVSGESMHEKEGAGQGSWVYLRNGTTLSSILKKEVGVEMDTDDIETVQVVEKGGALD